MKKTIVSLMVLLLLASACGPSSNQEGDITTMDKEAEIMEENEWKDLFNGENLEGWTSFGQSSVGEAWKVG
jgi:major membrane immunogen (membrane-anchored lipoprotein)